MQEVLINLMQEVLINLIRDMYSDITLLKSLSHLPEANELIYMLSL